MQMLSEADYMARSIDPSHFSGEDDLLLLREDLAEEWGAVIGYLECSCEIRDRFISEQFHEAAQDEIEHVIRLTRMLAALDPVQAEALQKEGLFWLAGVEHQMAIPPVISKEPSRDETENICRQGKQTSKRYFEPDNKTIECLRNAIRDELQAINVYQRQIRVTTNTMIQNELVTIMNQKKEHVAGFTNRLHNLLYEYRLPMR